MSQGFPIAVIRAEAVAMFQARQVSAKFGSVELSQVLIAETSLLAQRPGGEEKFPLRLGLGRPFCSDFCGLGVSQSRA